MKINKDTRILITGCGGMLGDAFYQYYSPIAKVLATDIDINAEWLQHLDVRDKEEIQKIFNEFNPNIVFHLAALTDLEYCENHPNEAYKTNTLGTENIVNSCKKLEIPLLYICTAGIFDGNKEFYDDWDVANPINHYGRAKWAGEEYIRHHLTDYFICRAGWMMGGGPKKDKKFVNKIIKQINDGKEILTVVDDKYGTPTYTHDFAKNSHIIIESGDFGVYNLICEGNCSRYDVALEIVKNLGLSKKVKVQKVSSDFYKNEYFAPRPLSEKLLPTRLQLKDLYIMQKWEKALQLYIKQYFI